MAPMVSIAMPVFNAEGLLSECLDSVMAQTFTDFELICINDGSNDRSGEILEAYAQRDERIRVIHQTNRGQYPTRNVALDKVTGKYMLSIDCDDAVSPQLLERLVHRAESEDADITLVGWDYVSGPYKSPDVRRWNLRKWQRGEAGAGFPMGYGYVWMKLYRTGFLRENGLRFRENFYTKADVIFHWNAMSVAEHVTVVPEALYHYRVHGNSVTGTIGRRFVQVIHVMEAIRDDLIALGDPKGLLDVWYPFALGFIHSAYRQLASEHRPEMEAELERFLGRLPEAGHRMIQEPGQLSPELRYFYRSLSGPSIQRLRFAQAYRWRTRTAPTIRRLLMPPTLRRRALQFIRRQSHNLAQSAIHDLRDTVDERNEVIARLAAENYELRQEVERYAPTRR